MNSDKLLFLLIIILLFYYILYFFQDYKYKKINIEKNIQHIQKNVNIEKFVPYTDKKKYDYNDENYYNLVEKINNNLDHYKNRTISNIYDDLTF